MSLDVRALIQIVVNVNCNKRNSVFQNGYKQTCGALRLEFIPVHIMNIFLDVINIRLIWPLRKVRLTKI